MQSKSEPNKQIYFGSVQIGQWFKECGAGAWHLKVTRSTGLYQSAGTRFEPAFATSELVFVE
jgi:hypothetical protein